MFNVCKAKINTCNTALSSLTVNKKGFSLLELTIVIAIIGILSAIVAPNLMHYTINKRNKVAYESANQFFIKAVAYFADTGGNSTVAPITLNFKWYVLDANINAIGSLTDTGGVISSSSQLEFGHKHTTRVYQLSASGVITIKP